MDVIKNGFVFLMCMVGAYVFTKFLNSFNQNKVRNLIRGAYIISFLCLFLSYFIESINLFLISLDILVIAVLTHQFYVKPNLELSAAFEDKVKQKLKIDGISKGYKKKLPRLIGGFMMPSLPIFSIINKKWKNRTEEAIIHEAVHQELIINKGYLIYYFGITFLVGYAVYKYIPNTIVFNIIMVSFISMLLVFFEYVTFKKTGEMAKELGVSYKSWNKGYVIKYFLIYFIQIIIAILIFSLIKFAFWLIVKQGGV